jgi:hypothetical protein
MLELSRSRSDSDRKFTRYGHYLGQPLSNLTIPDCCIDDAPTVAGLFIALRTPDIELGHFVQFRKYHSEGVS